MDLAWIDEFVDNIRPYVHIREEDRILIKKPNTAHKVNGPGVEVLDFLLNRNGSVQDILASQGHSEQVAGDLNRFFRDLQILLRGEMRDGYCSPAVDKVPFQLGYNTLPVIAEVAVTYQCNLSCRFCYAGCGMGCSRGEETGMSLEGVKRILQIIYHDAQAPTVSFTGGEPLLRTDLNHMVSHAKSLGFRVNLITNGTLVTADRARALADAGLDSAQVSIEGSRAEVHDRITGAPGSFERSVAALGHLVDAGVTVHHHTTVNRLNVGDITSMPKLAASLGLDRFSMNMVIPTGSAEKNRDILLRYTEIGKEVLAVQAAANEAGVAFLWYSPTPLCIFNPIIHDLGNKGCAACDGLISVSPSGDLLPCSSFNKPLGNLLQEGFRILWESRAAVRYRYKDQAPQACKACDRLALCNGGCPLYWNVMGYDELVGPREV